MESNDTLPSASSLVDLVHKAGRVALGHFGRVAPERKDDQSVVCEADREVEHLIVGELRERFPTHTVVGEEFGVVEGTDPACVWAVDPIDGTAAFLGELPTWCVCVGLVVDGTPTVGIVHFPVTGETFTADPTAGVARRVSANQVAETDRVGADSPVLSYATAHQDMDTDWPGRIWCVGSAAATIVSVARGSVTAGIIDPVASWDLAAATAILHAAGGVLVYLDTGEPVDLRPFLYGGRAPAPMLACHPALIDIVRPRFRWNQSRKT